jgi:uncharacterized protein YmfQ (DUF2313 family)
MNHAAVLRQLIPLALGGDQETDLLVEGAALDSADALIDDLLAEMHADSALDTLPDWERVYDLKPEADATAEARREDVLRAIRARGGLSKPYFIALAAAMGYEVEIEEHKAAVFGVTTFGDGCFGPEEARFWWTVKVLDAPAYYATFGEATFGDTRFSTFREAADLEAIFGRLKPAHTHVTFSYS